VLSVEGYNKGSRDLSLLPIIQELLMKTLMLVLSLTLLWSFSALAGKKVAVVSMLRGQVDVLTLGKTTPLKEKDSVEDGAVIKTAEKSFVKIIFFDKSQMNIGPNSEMKIEKFSGDDSGVIDLVKGKIRSQVTKDYLQMGRDKSKLFIKTPNAVMGVRGTDFMISTNGINTSTVLFEGEIVFNKLEDRGEVNSGNLESIVEKGVRMQPGEFSVMDATRGSPTEPALLNIKQIEKLEKNQNFESDRNPSAAKADDGKGSVVPAGLDGKTVSNNSGTINTEVSKVAVIEPPKSSSGNADGFVNGDKIKPANGSFVHIESGVIIPPGPGSVLDPNTNTYIAASGAGTVNADGNYVPPKNVEITPDGKIFTVTQGADGKSVVKEIAAPSPVLAHAVLGAVAPHTDAGGAMGAKQGTPQFPVIPDANDRRTATGGLANVTESRQVDSKTTTSATVRVGQ
jgi:hypothetical protein